jgi:hypothetical protein
VVEPLGLVEVKGKGAVETWRLVGPRRESRLDVDDRVVSG